MAGAVGGKLALGTREATQAQALGALLSGDAGPTIEATQSPAVA